MGLAIVWWLSMAMAMQMNKTLVLLLSACVIFNVSAQNFQKSLPEPANCKGVITLGALDAENKIEVYSALDPRTVIYAPDGGKQLPSSANWANNKLMVATYELDFLDQERPASLERGVGTSFAAPIVSGFISLWLSHQPNKQ